MVAGAPSVVLRVAPPAPPPAKLRSRPQITAGWSQVAFGLLLRAPWDHAVELDADRRPPGASRPSRWVRKAGPPGSARHRTTTLTRLGNRSALAGGVDAVPVLSVSGPSYGLSAVCSLEKPPSRPR